MVKLGFIVEGESEKKIIESAAFQNLLVSLDLDKVEKVINADGNGNLLPKYIEPYVVELTRLGAEKIIILADQENSPCITAVKDRIDPDRKYLVVISVKAIEAWFLADTDAISKYFKQNYFCEKPEDIEKPFDFCKSENQRIRGRGISDKIIFCKNMLKSGFTIENAACPSAAYFLQKLQSC